MALAKRRHGHHPDMGTTRRAPPRWKGLGGSGRFDEITGFLVLVAEDVAGDLHDAGLLLVEVVVTLAILEHGGACEEHPQLAIVELERDFGKLPGQGFDGLHRRTPCGVENGDIVFQKLVGDLALFVVVEIPFGSPGGVVGVEGSEAIVVSLAGVERTDRIHLLEREAMIRQPGAKFWCRAGHRQVVLAPVGHDGVWLGLGVIFDRLTRRRVAGRLSLMKVRTVSFEALQRDKRRARKRDELRLARGEVTPEQLQEENSLIPMGTKITILNLRETLERHYGK